MAEPKIKPAAPTADRELVISRIIDAPRERVWEAWTDPKQVVHWWGPTGFTTTIHKMEVRPGGVWEHTMRGPDGTEYPNHSSFIEVVKPERIVYIHGGGTKGVKGVSFQSTWTFEAVTEDGREKTRLTMRGVFETAEERNRVVEEFGALEGGKQTLGRLDEYVSGNATLPDLVLTRTLDAPRDLVVKVWTDPQHLKQWWGPACFTNPRCDVDARVGGKMHIDMKGPDGVIYPMQGTFTELSPPEKLAFTSSALDAQGKPLFDVLTTVTFAVRHGKTFVTVEARVTRKTPEAAPYLQGMNAGWNQSLERMADYAAINAPEAFAISRTFDAPRDLVFKVWTEKDHLMKWFGPKGFTMKIGKLDIRPGGMFHYAMTSPDGKEMWGKWIFRDIAAPEWITLVSSFSDADGGATRHPFAKDWPLETLSLTTFEEEQGKTRLTVHWVPHTSATAAERKVFGESHASMRQGWGGTMDMLAEYLAKL